MIDLYKELEALIHSLSNKQIPYALCGGLAMAVHGLPRATVDIDLLILTDDIDNTIDAVRSLGYTIRSDRMRLHDGNVIIERVNKIIDTEVLSLDMLVVTPALEEVWKAKSQYEWGQMTISVVDKAGLIQLKSFRNSGVDQDDIAFLRQQLEADQ